MARNQTRPPKRPARSAARSVGNAFKEFRNVGDPEGTLEAGSYLMKALAETHFSPRWKCSDCTGEMEVMKQRCKEVTKRGCGRTGCLAVGEGGGRKIGAPGEYAPEYA